MYGWISVILVTSLYLVSPRLVFAHKDMSGVCVCCRNYYQLDSPPLAKRIAYPPSPTRQSSPHGLPPFYPQRDMSDLACFPITPSSSGDEDRNVEQEEDDAGDDDDWYGGAFRFGDCATSVRLSSTVPTDVVHRSLESDSGLESFGVSPLSDDQPSQSSGKNSTSSVSPSTDNESVVPEKSTSSLVKTDSQHTSMILPTRSSSHLQSSQSPTDYLSVLSRSTGSWLGATPSAPGIQRYVFLEFS